MLYHLRIVQYGIIGKKSEEIVKSESINIKQGNSQTRDNKEKP